MGQALADESGADETGAGAAWKRLPSSCLCPKGGRHCLGVALDAAKSSTRLFPDLKCDATMLFHHGGLYSFDCEPKQTVLPFLPVCQKTLSMRKGSNIQGQATGSGVCG